MSSSTEHPRIGVIGLGGVGGYLAALLAKKYDNVTVVARGARYEAVRKNGLVLHSGLNGEVVSHPRAIAASAHELPQLDYLFISVKNYSLEELLPQIKNAVTPDTVLIPVMNGIDPGDRVAAAYPQATVIKSLIYIVSFALPDFSIHHPGNFADIRLGTDHPDEIRMKKAQAVCSLLTGAGIRCKVAPDITLAIWKKYVLNCAFNVETAAYNLSIGQLREDPEKAAQYEALTWEAFAVAKAKGVPMTRQDCEDIIYRFYNEYDYDSTSSLQRDLREGKPAEVETFSGYIVEQAAREGVDVPVSARMYELLKKKQPVF